MSYALFSWTTKREQSIEVSLNERLESKLKKSYPITEPRRSYEDSTAIILKTLSSSDKHSILRMDSFKRAPYPTLIAC